jgi:hypothetical protein
VTASYRQELPGLDLTIEQATERTPDKRSFHVFLRGELVGSHKKLDAAQRQFKKLRDESGWQPPERSTDLTPEEMLARERELYQRSIYLEYWSQSHKFRGGGRPKRK